MDNWIWIVLLLLVAALAVVFLRKRKPSELEETSPTNAPNPSQPAGAAAWQSPGAVAPSQPAQAQPGGSSDPDQQVLDQLRAAGSDLSKLHEMEFFLYFPTEEAAQQAGRKLETDGFDGEVRRAPDRSAWLCLVYKQMTPERTKLTALRKRFNALAREFGGEYDGWETAIEK